MRRKCIAAAAATASPIASGPSEIMNDATSRRNTMDVKQPLTMPLRKRAEVPAPSAFQRNVAIMVE